MRFGWQQAYGVEAGGTPIAVLQRRLWANDDLMHDMAMQLLIRLDDIFGSTMSSEESEAAAKAFAGESMRRTGILVDA